MFYEQRLEIAREIGDRRGEGSGLGNLGIAYVGLGETNLAIGFCEQALSIFEGIGHPNAELVRGKIANLRLANQLPGNICAV